MPERRDRVVLESTGVKAYASMLDWPGWSRWAKTEDGAVQTVLGYAPRYQVVVELAGLDGLPSTATVVDRVAGDASTSFGVPAHIHAMDHEPLDAPELKRQVALLQACWSFFDQVAASVSAELRKGPRGGGRDRDKIIEHVVEADRGYARKIGVKTARFDPMDRGARDEHLEAVYAAIPALADGQVEGTNWPARYFVRRAAWHILDHAWEMQDKDLS